MIKTNNLKSFRIEKNLTQQEVADYLNIAQSQYNKHENGKSLLNARQIIMLCELYRCTPNDILGFKGLHAVITSELDEDN